MAASASDRDSVNSDLPLGLRSSVIESDAAHDVVNSDKGEADRLALNGHQALDADPKTDHEAVVETQKAGAGIDLMAGLGIQRGRVEEHVDAEVTESRQEVSSEVDAESSKSA